MKSVFSRLILVLNLLFALASPTTLLAQTIAGPAVSIHAGESVGAEGGANATFIVTRYGPLTNALTAGYSIGGTASNGVDYVSISDSVTFATGVSKVVIVISPIDDTVAEPTENVILTLKTNSNYVLVSPTSATVAIFDNDNLRPTIEWIAPAGEYSLTARVTDNFESRATSAPVVVNITAPTNTPPNVHIFTPTNGSVFFAPTNISIGAEASDSDGWITTVEFFAGTNRLAIVTNNPASAGAINPFQITWTNPPLGEFVLTARATDNGGLATTSPPVYISVREKTLPLPIVTIRATDTSAAEIPPFSTIPLNPGVFQVTRSFASPQPLVVNYGIEGTASNGVDYQTLSGSITISSNESSANIYVVAIDDSLIEGTETVVLNIRTNSAYLVGDPHQATVSIEDNDHATNPPPVVQITAPTNHAVFIAPTNILISAEASDTNGQVVRVDFFSGDKLLGSSSNAPFEFLWTNALPGSYNLGARATDNDGAIGSAPIVPITVRSPNEIAFVKRTLPIWYVPGVKLIVRLRAEPPAGTTSYSIADHPPTNWIIGAVSNDGNSSSPSQVSFGPFNDGLARTLTYEVTPPATETGEKHFIGTANANGVTTPIGGNSSIVPAPPHPADNNPTDFVIAENELSAYVAAWKRCERWTIAPNPIPINYVTRAGFLFSAGGDYTFSTHFPTPYPPLLWVSTDLVETIGTNTTASGEIPWSINGPGSAICSMPTNYFPGVPFTVTIAITPGSNTLAYALEERPPEGWAITNISDAGVFCPITGKIRWGLFLTNTPLTVSYQVTPRTNATSSLATFAGVASFNGLNVPIIGQRTVRYSAATTGPAAKLQSITTTPTGDRLMTFLGEAGVEYNIEASSNFIDWTPLESLLNNDGVLQYIDVAGEQLEQRYYRVVPAQ
jgi:hypothetical protein